MPVGEARAAASQTGGARRIKSPLSPAQAAVVFGLRNVRALAPSPVDADLGDTLGRATGPECLDAAFRIAGGVAGEVVGGLARGGPTTKVPFCDRPYYGAIARWLGCPLLDARTVLAIARRADGGDINLGESGAILRYSRRGVRQAVIAPDTDWLPSLAQTIVRRPELRGRLAIAPPEAIEAAARLDGATVQRGRIAPLHTVPGIEVADRVVSRWQAALFGLLIGFATLATALAPTAVFIVTVIAVTAVLLAYAGSRALALVLRPPPTPPRRRLRDDELPVYTVLIPLYREDEGVRDLVAALARLDYPPDRLDIQFLVEADDPVTRNALVREATHLRCRVCVVPEGRPRTKPRALNAGLRQARGTLLTIFDAEDRPDPGQLRLAAETFALAPPDLAALQARLCIDHVGDNWLTKMFAIEYACQFDRLLPMVSGRGGIVLLGGTSNHFRIDALIGVGGWDPFNVTEDADLAIRLRRRGYRLGVIASDTWEEAPLTVKAWVKQRSRWFKGYLQTWLVHNRRPGALVREIGWRDTALVHLFIVGAFTAALAHNLFLISLALACFGLLPLFGGQSGWLVGGQLALSAASYGVNFALGAVSVRGRGGHISAWAVLWFPLYWVLMGFAAALAFHDLVRRPHHWRKTTHGIANRPSSVAPAGAVPAT